MHDMECFKIGLQSCNNEEVLSRQKWIIKNSRFKFGANEIVAAQHWIFWDQILLLLQSALQPLWVLACLTIVEYSQQEGFYRVPLPAARQTLNLEDQWFRTFQLWPPGVPSVWNDVSELRKRKVDLWARNFREFCRKWRLPRHFWVLLHAVNLRHGTDGFTSPPKEGALRIFSAPKNSTASPGFEPANSGTKGQHAHP